MPAGVSFCQAVSRHCSGLSVIDPLEGRDDAIEVGLHVAEVLGEAEGPRLSACSMRRRLVAAWERWMSMNLTVV